MILVIRETEAPSAADMSEVTGMTVSENEQTGQIWLYDCQSKAIPRRQHEGDVIVQIGECQLPEKPDQVLPNENALDMLVEFLDSQDLPGDEPGSEYNG